MASAEEIRLRIGSIAQTKKVTDAMYMISSVKMRRALQEVESTRPYFRALKNQIGDLFRYIPDNNSRYFRAPLPEGQLHRRRGILLITSDKGLAGSYNPTALKEAEAYMRRHPETVLFIVGECGRQYFSAQHLPFVQDFAYSAAFPTVWEARQICTDLLERYNNAQLDEIDIIYTDYHTNRPSECKRNCLLPLDKSRFSSPERTAVTPKSRVFYPDAVTVLDGVAPSYLTGFIYSCLVDSYCSEQEERMTAMHTAGQNAEDMLKNLRSQYNALRQAAITREVVEISAGAQALKRKKKKSEVQHP